MEKWVCHCCSASNEATLNNCRVCGREESYAQEGYPLPLHGVGARLFRPSQITSVMTEAGLYETDEEKWTALHSAAVYGNTPTVMELLKLDCVIDAKTSKGQTALHLAAYSGSLSTVECLVQKGANINVATFFEQMTPLHLACKRNWKEIARFLIDRGAKVNAVNIIGRTPLHFAAENGRTDLGALLLRSGAKAAALDHHGWTARQVAELYNHRTFQELLVVQDQKDKQTVVRELPPAPWHGTLWNDFISVKEKERNRTELERQKQLKLEEEIAVYRTRAKQAKVEARRTRQLQNMQQHTATFSDVLAEISNNGDPQPMRSQLWPLETEMGLSSNKTAVSSLGDGSVKKISSNKASSNKSPYDIGNFSRGKTSTVSRKLSFSPVREFIPVSSTVS